ncbi:Uncharacterised protein [Mycobacteroides abscessus subsp. bolletii]|nr:Uncharacterised protein [Mycobacteroides abscessus subsp. bolletii]
MSSLLAMLSIGQGSMTLLSKVVGLSDRKVPTVISKLIECASLLALAMATGTVLWTYQSARPPTPSEVDELKHLPAIQVVSSALHIYYSTVLMSIAAFALLYIGFWCGRVRGELPKFMGVALCVFGFALISLAIIPQVQIAYPKKFNGMDYFFYAAMVDFFLAVILVTFSWLTRPKDTFSNAVLRRALWTAFRGRRRIDFTEFFS